MCELQSYSYFVPNNFVAKWRGVIRQDIRTVWQKWQPYITFAVHLFHLLKIKVQNTAFTASEIETEIETVKKSYNISKQEAEYFIFSDKVSNSTYNIEKANINILMKNGDVIDITSASGQFNIEALKKTINKYFLCYPKLK